jgi:RNA recognition motif-containing protein
VGRKETAISTKVFVGNLNFAVTRQELTDLLSEVGRVVDVHLPVDRETGRPRGFAFVEFSTEGEASEAITRFNNREVAGRRLNVNAAEERRRRPEGPPVRPSRISGPPPDFVPDDNPFAAPFGGARRPFKSKGSRRGMRGRKRSLNF